MCFCRWEELHALASEPVENHVFFAEHFYDAVNGLYTTLATFSVCSATPQGQWALPTQHRNLSNPTATQIKVILAHIVSRESQSVMDDGFRTSAPVLVYLI